MLPQESHFSASLTIFSLSLLIPPPDILSPVLYSSPLSYLSLCVILIRDFQKQKGTFRHLAIIPAFENLLLHLHNSLAMQQTPFLLLTPLPLTDCAFLPLFSLFGFAYLTEAIAMPADLCSADMSAKLLRYAVTLTETAFVSPHCPISEDSVTSPANVPPLRHSFYLHKREWVSTVTADKTSDSP